METRAPVPITNIWYKVSQNIKFQMSKHVVCVCVCVCVCVAICKIQYIIILIWYIASSYIANLNMIEFIGTSPS